MSESVPDGRVSQETPPFDIAVIGIGCRFPGATCLEEFWNVLSNGENHITEFPSDRWVVEDFYDQDPDAVGKSYTKKAGFIKNFANFDHKLFGIGETEAIQMDPQQRQVLECTYMALEDAGITRQQIDGQKVGVYIGSMNTDYNMRMVYCSDVIDQYSVAGLAASVIANRVSYLFNLTGPSMSIDTACSSSIVAIHQAILGLKAGDSSLAICGGVSLIIHPQVFTPLCKAQMLSRTGQCHAFSSDADGYTRGEGCGIVILKPLEKALADGDNIWGTLVTGLNQDGHFAQPMTAPSEMQQLKLLKDVFTTHHIDPSTVQYIEAHGTGTRRGDPVEISAFASFFSNNQRQRYIGSVKTNIGHLEPAAGVAGLIKVLLMMKHNTIVPSLHFDKPNELIDFEKCQFVVPTKCVSWKDDTKVACLNSFGFGGANSHAVIKGFKEKPKLIQNTQASYIVCFSGSTFQSLFNSILDFIKDSDGLDVRSVAYTSTVCREHYKFRKAWVVDKLEKLQQNLKNFTDHEQTQMHHTRQKTVIFVFCGMGTAWQGMCKDMMDWNNNFRESIEIIDKSLQRFVSWSLTQRFEASYNVNDPIFGPIALFACQVALARLWESWGIIPQTVVGQSIGEVAAAHIAGILSLDEAVRVIYHRTSIMSHATGGKMLLIRNLDTKTVEKLCENFKDRLNVALYYSPVSCTVSGDCESVTALKCEIAELLKAQTDVQLIDLNVTSAFHSHHMISCQQEVDDALCNLKTEAAKIRMISTVDPGYTNVDLMSSDYWGKNLRMPVRFHNAITTAAGEEDTLFLEIGPKPILRAHLKDNFGSTIPLSVSSMFENSKEADLLTSLAVLYENNKSIKWDSFVKQCYSKTPVPKYSFVQKKLWKLGVLTREEAFGSKTGKGKHLFLKLLDGSSECKVTIRPSDFSTVYEHKVKGLNVIPGATYADTGFAIVQLLKLGNPHTSTISVKFSSPATLKKGTPSELAVNISKLSPHETIYTISKCEIVHAQGTIVITKELYGEDRIDLQTIKDRCSQHVPGRDVYQMLEQSGFTYGEAFATIDHAFRGEGESLAVLKMSPRVQQEMKQTLFHPAVLDGMLQAPTVTYFQTGDFLPIEISGLTLRYPLQKEMFVYTKLTQVIGVHVSFFLCLIANDGTIVAQIRKFSTKMIVLENFDEKSATYQKEWIQVDVGRPDETDKRNIIMFTESTPTDIDLPCKFLKQQLINANAMETFESAFHDIQKIILVFEIPRMGIDGQNLLDELIKRITRLRLMILYYTIKDLQIPLFLLMESRESTDSQGIEAATSCLNEAINAFCRCVLREFKSLPLKTVVICTIDRNDFISRIPTAIDFLSSGVSAEFYEIKMQDDKAHMFELCQNLNSTPSYRTTCVLDSAVLCSKLQNAVVEPTFILSKPPQKNVKVDEAEFLVSSAVIHSQSLFWVTVEPQQNFGFSDLQTHPVMSLEFTGKVKSKADYDEMLACYPSQIRNTIVVPRRCTLQKNRFPQYEPGHLLKLYTLWCMCSNHCLKSVAILYVPDTEPLAKALKILLRSKHVKSIYLVKADEVSEIVHPKSLIATVLLTADIAGTVAEKWKELENIICLENITNPQTVGVLTSCHWLTVSVLRPSEIFSLSAMFRTVPKMLQWIKSHSKELMELASLLHGCASTPLNMDVKPINMTEVLETAEVDLTKKEDSIFDLMKTPSTHLIKNTRTYLVVGGLTGLGWECVSFLASKGAGCVIILNRSEPNEQKRREIEELEKANGCMIKPMQCDLTNFKCLKDTVSRIRDEYTFKPLAGIFYGAAVLRDATLLELTADDLRSSLSPKVCGTWNLHILTSDLPLDFFVFHSSGTSVLGNAGQSNYGAGNGFMDELAHCRRRGGLSGQSINWGPLGLGMLQDNQTVVKRLQTQGFNLIEKKDISQCLTHLLMLNETQSIMIKIDRRKMAEHMMKNKEKSVLAHLKDVLEPVMKNFQDMERVGVKQSFNTEKLQACSHEEALQMLKMYVKNLVCDKALLDEDTFDMKVEMKTQGVDSMYAMEISGEIMSDLDVKLSVQEIQLQSAATLAQCIVEKLLKEENVINEETDNELIVSKHTILSSIAASFFGFNTRSVFRMGFVLVCTVQMPDVANHEQMSEILRKCISLHKLARSTFTFTEQNFALNVLSVDEAFDFHTISGTDATEVSRLKEEPINLESHGPLRFIFLTGSKKLIIVFHKFVFDIRAVTIFVNDILRISNRTGFAVRDDEVAVDVDIAEQIQKVLAPQFQTLREFWKPRIARISQNSFHGDPPSDQLQHHSKNHIVVTKTLSTAFYRKITEFSKEHKLTVFEYIVSIYQLYLSFFSNAFTSAVTTSIDTRTSVPALVRSLGRCTNLVPLLCQLADPYASVSEFLNRNKKDIEMFLQNSMFPFTEMEKMVEEDRVDNLSRNIFFFEDDTLTSEHNKLTVEQAAHFVRTETVMYLWQKKMTRTLDIKFHLNWKLYSTSRGRAILDEFVDLLSFTLDHPEATIQHLKQRHSIPKVTQSMNKSKIGCSVM